MFIQFFLAGSAIVTGIVQLYRPRRPGMLASLHLKNEGDTKDYTKGDKNFSEQDEMNRHFALSLGVTALSAIGSLGHPAFLIWSLPGFLYFNIYFLRRGYNEIQEKKRLGIASTDAVVVTGTILTRAFFPSSLFIFLYFLSEKLLYTAEHSTERSLAALMADLPEVAWLSKSAGSEQHTQAEVKVTLESLNSDDIIVIYTGEMVPVDGIVASGDAQALCHPLLGMGRQSTLSAGDRVLASTIVQSGMLWIQVKEVGESTQLAQINHSFKQHLCQTGTYKSQAWVEKGVLPMFLLSIGTVPFKGITSGISVLLTYFGYDLRVVAPIGTLSFMKIALQEGIVIRDSRVLETLYSIDTILFFNADPEGGILLYELPQQSKMDSFGSTNLSKSQPKQQISRTTGSDKSQFEQFAEQAQVKHYPTHECKNVLDELNKAGRTICTINADMPTLAMMQDRDVSVVIGNIGTQQARLAQICIPDGDVEQLMYLFDLGKAQHANLHASLWSTAIPSIFCLGGIYFLHFGVLTSIIIDYFGLIAGVMNAMLPSVKYNLQNQIKNR